MTFDELNKPPFDRFIKRLSEAEERNEMYLGVLKTVAKNIQESGIEQPTKCFFGCGSCGYPIDDCYNCPCHTWSVNYMPITHCEFK